MIDSGTDYWFAMRVRHSNPIRLMRMKELLDNEAGVAATYVAMRFQRVSPTKIDLAPAVNNLIFVRTTCEHMKSIKGNKVLYDPLSYIMHPVSDAHGKSHSEILTVPDKMMNDFIRVTSEANDKVVYFDNLSYACKPGQEVMITNGSFAGVKGVVKRIKGNVCVVIPIKQTIAVAITGLRRSQMVYLTEKEEPCQTIQSTTNE